MKKRFVAALLVSAMAVSLAACGSSSDSESTTSESSSESTSEAAEETSSGEDYNILMIVKHTDEHFLRVMAGAQAYADEYDNISVEFYSPTSESDYDGQMNAIETSLNTDEYDALIIAPLQSTTVANLVEGTEKTIIALDTDFDSDYKVAYVGTGNEEATYEGGAAAAQMAIENGSESPTAVIITGPQGDETHDARLTGYTNGVEDNGGEVVDVQYCNNDPEKVTTAMEAIIEKYPEGVDIIMGTGDVSSVAAVKAIQDSGNENYDDTIVVGFDGTQEAVELVQEGSIGLEVAQLGYDMGYLAMEAAVADLEGEEVDSVIDSGCELLTVDDVDDYIAEMEEKGAWDLDTDEEEETEE